MRFLLNPVFSLRILWNKRTPCLVLAEEPGHFILLIVKNAEW
jgi:hypothetical protein